MRITPSPRHTPQPILPQPTPPPGGGQPPVEPPQSHAHHSMDGSLLHVGHDAAMLMMTAPPADPTLPDMPICGGDHAQPPATMDHHGMSMHHAMPMNHSMPMGHDMHHGSGGGSLVMHASAGISAAVAVGSALHGWQMLQAPDTRSKLQGANHLVMSASTACMAASMWMPAAGLGPVTSLLMGAHGAGEMGLGASRALQGWQSDCRHDQVQGLLQVAHGGCLAAAQLFPGAALPLYVGMAAATAAQRLYTLAP